MITKEVPLPGGQMFSSASVSSSSSAIVTLFITKTKDRIVKILHYGKIIAETDRVMTSVCNVKFIENIKQ